MDIQSPADILQRLETRVLAHDRALDIPPLSRWIRSNHITLEGRTLELESRPWLRQLYDDPHPFMVLRKATQVGGSVWAILSMLQKCMEVPNWRGTVYFFPTKTDVTDFSQTRVGPLMEENPSLKGTVGDIDKVGVRQVGAGFLYFRGMRSKTGMKSVPADGIVFDELDEATEEAKAMAAERLAASPYKFRYELSNPSLPGYGIDYAYTGSPETGHQGSDQRLWHIRCSRCRNWVSMESEFPQALGAEDLKVLRPSKKYLTSWRRDAISGVPIEEMGWYRACPKCDKMLIPVDGEWVAARPSVRSPHGYSLSQLYSPTVPVESLVKTYLTTKTPHHFFNLCIGIAWMPAEDRLTPAHVIRYCADYPNQFDDPGPCTMGVDQGNDLHVVISKPGPLAFTRKIVHIGVYKDWEQLDVLMHRFNVRLCVVDRLPEQRNARSFALRHKKRVYLNTYNETQVGRPKWKHEELTVNENRTELLDISRAPFHHPMGDTADPTPQHPVILLPRDCWEVQEFARQVAAPIKKREEEDDGSVFFTYVSPTPDHFAHAWAYDCVAWAYDANVPARPNQGGAHAAAGSGKLLPPSKRRSVSVLDLLTKKTDNEDGY